ncbi:MAG TPA: PAS domain-containing sensor histidine kinase [Burkholderiaceae bacterium]
MTNDEEESPGVPSRSAHGAWNDTDAQALLGLLLATLRRYGVAFIDLEGRVRGWSEGCHAITGFAADDVLGHSAAVLFTPEDVARELHMHEMNSARLLGHSEDERWHMRKDGSRFWASGITLLLGTTERPLAFAKLFRDATHLRLRMDSLENEVRQMRKERSDRDVFLATIAHELRNPLQPMSVATHLLGEACDQARHGQAVKILDRQLGFIERLVEDLIDMTRLGQGRMAIDLRRVELQRLLQDAADSRNEAARAKGIALACIVPPVPITVEVDPARFDQVVVNLLNNAIKFTPDGGRVTLLANVDQTHFTVRVQDTGRGISAELQPRLFTMFTQADPVQTGRGQGLGIGLALVKELVSLHHGSVEVRSEGAGRGSEFLVRIPLEQPVAFEGRSDDEPSPA